MTIKNLANDLSKTSAEIIEIVSNCWPTRVLTMQEEDHISVDHEIIIRYIATLI